MCHCTGRLCSHITGVVAIKACDVVTGEIPGSLCHLSHQCTVLGVRLSIHVLSVCHLGCGDSKVTIDKGHSIYEPLKLQDTTA